MTLRSLLLSLALLAASSVAHAAQSRVAIQLAGPTGFDLRAALCEIAVFRGDDPLARGKPNADYMVILSVDVDPQVDELVFTCFAPGLEPVQGVMARLRDGFAARVVFSKGQIVGDVRTTNERTTMAVSLPLLKLQTVNTPAGAFQKIVPPTGAFALRAGDDAISFPETPQLHATIGAPIGSRIKRVVVEKVGARVQEGVRLWPVQPLAYDPIGGGGNQGFKFDPEAYKRGGTDAARPLGVRAHAQMLTNLWDVSLSLVDYDPATLRLTTYTKLAVSVEYDRPNGCFRQNPADEHEDFSIHDDVDNQLDRQHAFYSYPVINRDAVLSRSCDATFTSSDPGARLIILTHPSFLRAAGLYAAHKESLGISTRVVTTADVAQAAGVTGLPTPQQIRKFLEDLHVRMSVKPMWLLILGDAEYVPTYYDERNLPDPALNAGDIYYGQIGSTNVASLPLYGVGRIPVDYNPETGDAQAWDVLNKIIAYETQPSLDATFYGGATLAGYFQDNEPDGVADLFNFVEFVEKDLAAPIAARGLRVDRLYKAPAASHPSKWSDGTPLSATLTSGFDWSPTTAKLTGAITNGTPLLLHRGHGNRNGWGNPDITTSDLSALNATNSQFPVVLAVNCGSGLFDNETVNAAPYKVGGGLPGVDAGTTYFAEALLRNPKGALGVIADTRTSFRPLNNDLAKGFVDAVYKQADASVGQTTYLRLGDLLNTAKGYVLQQNGAPGSLKAVRQELVIFNLLGDPTVELRLTRPMLPTVTSSGIEDVKNPQGQVVGRNVSINLIVKDPLCPQCAPVPITDDEDQWPVVVLQNPTTGEVLGRTHVMQDGTVFTQLRPDTPARVKYTISGRGLKPVAGVLGPLVIVR